MTVSIGGQASALLRVKTLTPLVALAAACAVPLLFPGDAPFINDEPRLIANAFLSNQQHRLAHFGLQGTQGYSYGPLPTWVYQALLLLSRDLSIVVFWRALFVTALTAASLVWLARTAKLWPWFSVAIMLSPYLWFYSRALWDNSFCIPVAGLAFAGYVAFVERETAPSFALLIAALWALTFIHLMSLALTVPIALHLALTRRTALWRYKWVGLAISAIAVGAAHSYCSYLLRAPHLASGHPSLRAALFPLLAPRYFSATGLEYFFGPAHLQSVAWLGWLARACSWVSMLSYPLVWGGMALAVAETLRAIQARRLSTRQHAIILALTVLGAQMALNGLTGTEGHPHYYNATWIAFAVFAWLTADWLATRAMAIFAPYACALAASLLLLVATIRIHGGTRENYGPTLANQMEIAAELARYPPSTPLQLNVRNYQLYPHALATLRLLRPVQPVGADRPSRLFVVYASSDPANGRIRLVED